MAISGSLIAKLIVLFLIIAWHTYLLLACSHDCSDYATLRCTLYIEEASYLYCCYSCVIAMVDSSMAIYMTTGG